MDKEYFIKLTSDLYQLTLFFPKKEPLRYKMRELANNILADLTMILDGDEAHYKDLIYDIRRNIKPLDDFCEIAKSQKWVSEEDIESIQERYRAISEEIDEFEEETVEEKNPVMVEKPVAITVDLNHREKKIVEFLEKEGKAQVASVQPLFPNLTKRTLRRDFDSLLKKGVVRREGKANSTFYRLS